MGYPAARGSTVLVKAGVAYGLGVLRTDIFDEHVKEGRDCCSKTVVMLKSTQHVEEEDLPDEETMWEDKDNQSLGPVAALERFVKTGRSAPEGPLRRHPSQRLLGRTRSKSSVDIDDYANEPRKPSPRARFSMAAMKRSDFNGSNRSSTTK
ncbi:hypothetical protein HDU96_006251 [Phlyctochytrium bullatum]|nr:hypothetical protein HDU96_006251 [Phlyctochytrium bullatum]